MFGRRGTSEYDSLRRGARHSQPGVHLPTVDGSSCVVCGQLRSKRAFVRAHARPAFRAAAIAIRLQVSGYQRSHRLGQTAGACGVSGVGSGATPSTMPFTGSVDAGSSIEAGYSQVCSLLALSSRSLDRWHLPAARKRPNRQTCLATMPARAGRSASSILRASPDHRAPLAKPGPLVHQACSDHRDRPGPRGSKVNKACEANRGRRERLDPPALKDPRATRVRPGPRVRRQQPTGRE